MKIGIVSNSDYFIPLASALVAQKQQGHLYYSSSADLYTNQKAKTAMMQLNIPYVEERNRAETLYFWLNENHFDVCFVFGYGRLIHLEKIQTKKTQLFNIHFGPLPAFKGPTPIFWQLKQGIPFLGLTIHRLTQKFDEGGVVWSKEVKNESFFTYKYVEQLFCNLIVEGVFFVLNERIQGKKLIDVERKAVDSSRQTRPKLEDIQVNWEKMSSLEICNLIKACNPWNKGALTFYKNTEFKLMDAREIDMGPTCNPGTIIELDKTLRIQCYNHHAIEVSMVYFMDSYYAAYQLGHFGFKTGIVLK
jgi:methionyl-tRNA formyltransferase